MEQTSLIPIENESVSEVVNEEYREIIPLERMIGLRQKGLSYSEIGAIVGCSKENVFVRLRAHVNDIEALKDFKENRADTFALYQRKILKTVDEATIKKAPLAARTLAIAQLYDKERLERGETTQNIGYADYSKALEQVIRDRQRLEAELGLDRAGNGLDETMSE